jgi:hypothetical protein
MSEDMEAERMRLLGKCRKEGFVFDEHGRHGIRIWNLGCDFVFGYALEFAAVGNTL